MHILITGASGMLGRKLTSLLCAQDLPDGSRPTRLTLCDVVEQDTPQVDGIAVTTVTSDLTQPGAAEALIADKPDAIVHLAAMVSAACERDMPGGYAANVGATQALFEAIRIADYHPRVVFSSSIAVFGAPLPDFIEDDHLTAPQTCYGTQKAMCELMLDDYSRRGIFDGIGLRLPTLSIRPGKPNAAASGFMSGILREPLAGQRANLPVGDDYTHWFASPRAAAGFVRHALQLDTAKLGHRRTLNMPGACLSVADLLAALKDHAGDSALALIDRNPDAEIHDIVTRWPRGFTPTRARALGFTAETSAAELIRVYLEDHPTTHSG